MGRKITIHIEGYGDVVVKRPKVLTEESYSDSLAVAVAKTAELMSPGNQSERFHPVLGRGGYVEDKARSDAHNRAESQGERGSSRSH